MNKKNESTHIVEMPPERRGMAAFQELKSGRHTMFALLDVDVTLARKFIEDYKARTGEQLSFTGYLIACLAGAVDQDKTVQSYRKGSRKLVMYDDVDVGFMIEQKRGDKPFLTAHVIKAANRKNYWEIDQEIRTVQSGQKPTSEQQASWFRRAMQLPWPLSVMVKGIFRTVVSNNPTLVTNMAGTVGISSVGMFGKGHSGWGIASGSHSLDLVVGGTANKLAEVEGRIETRQMLSLTIIFDHDVIDGAPAARFTRKLVELIEAGYGLDESILQTGATGLTEPPRAASESV
jgi:pyruvate/2-oxoglutarate dehydrogenase complex dihydrolipoamide acyltransferase (E2) component